MKIKKNAWLFAFTDLSFLLLICLSLIPSAPAKISLHIAEMNLPTVPDNRNLHPVPKKGEVWELQIFKVSAEHATPFRLIQAGSNQGRDLTEATLLPALAGLQARGVRPMLLPEKTSQTQDFLFAAGALARVWSPTSGGAIVRTSKTGVQQ